MAFRSQLVCPQHFCFAGLPFSYPWLPDFGFLAASTGIALCRMESCGGDDRNGLGIEESFLALTLHTERKLTGAPPVSSVIQTTSFAGWRRHRHSHRRGRFPES